MLEVTYTFTDKKLEEELKLRENIYGISIKEGDVEKMFKDIYRNNYKKGEEISEFFPRKCITRDEYNYDISNTNVVFFNGCGIDHIHQGIKITGVRRNIQKAEDEIRSKGFKLEEIK